MFVPRLATLGLSLTHHAALCEAAAPGKSQCTCRISPASFGARFEVLLSLMFALDHGEAMLSGAFAFA